MKNESTNESSFNESTLDSKTIQFDTKDCPSCGREWRAVTVKSRLGPREKLCLSCRVKGEVKPKTTQRRFSWS